MKMKVCLSLMAAMMIMMIDAAPVSESRAWQLALQTKLSTAPSFRALSLSEPQPVYAPRNAEGEVDFYVFNFGTDDGFVIIAGDDCARTVLARADSGHFDPDAMPCNVKWWLANYQHEMGVLRSRPQAAYRVTEGFPVVAPMLKTWWSQSSPFNDYCPTYDDFGFTERCVTGCVATAMSQIMNFYQWPERGKRSHSYFCHVNNEEDSILLSADFDHPYHWDLMLDDYYYNYSQSNADAVARLMSDVGIAVEMGYGETSGAYTHMAANALFKFFGYDPRILSLTRNDSTPEAWDLAMVQELQKGRPIFYTGNDGTRGGHAFVLDGCSADGLFHINWGWGGRYDSYFALTLLNPSYDHNYTNRQFALLGVRPDTDGQSPDAVGMCARLLAESEVVALGDTALIDAYNSPVRGVLDWNVMSWGLFLTDSSGENELLNFFGFDYDQGDTPPYSEYWSMNWSVTEIPCVLPKDMPEGSYRLYYAWSSDLWQTRHAFLLPESHPGYLTVDVRDGKARFCVRAISLYGDVSGDGKVDVDDLNILINIILGIAQPTDAADVTGDRRVDIADINAVINTITGQ